MGSLQLRFSSPALRIISPKTPKAPLSGIIRCGPRKPLCRGRVLSTEAIHAVHALKLAKSSPKPRRSSSPNSKSSNRMEEVFRDKLGRLLKADQIAVLTELRRQNEWEMALQVFAFIQKEVWYKPDLSVYSDMIFMVAKNKLIEIAEQLFSELKKEGLQPDTRAYTEMIGAFLQVGMVEKAMDMYKLMKESGCNPDKLTLTILIRNLEKAGEKDLASAVRRECAEYVDFPEKFLEEVDKKFVSIPLAKKEVTRTCLNYMRWLPMKADIVLLQGHKPASPFERHIRSYVNGMGMAILRCLLSSKHETDISGAWATSASFCEFLNPSKEYNRAIISQQICSSL